MRIRDLLLIVAGAIFVWMAYNWWTQPRAVPQPIPVESETPRAQPVAKKAKAPEPLRAQAQPEPQIVTAEERPKKLTLNYKIDDGIVTVLGDVAVGMPTDPHAAEQGIVAFPPFKLWKSGTIPYFIQPAVVQPERIRQAFQLFQGTGLQFVELTNQEDAMIFETTDGICKSYLGRAGGRQPVWIAPNCGPPEIAHEIMHALGFIHEQNRADRDGFIDVHFDNIEEQYRFNFEKLPQDFMRVSGATPFDFSSLMLYPVWMFATGGQSTMESKLPDQQIAPGQVLSKSDVERINRVYGSKPSN